ncbi:hypothetical protein [Agrobacterium larrymoorei]|uniref:Uncharacterized protein n=1 Tax=Agrobacterium larrymoorei TaxID=160699 RepID=A0ABX8T1C6_9HYPH|nr:hypothetical protein [Agrobacterium larrymoorei]QYA06083.1 hypothetical protein J5285_08300 [Agrobacterium larrymoorei]
MTNHNMVLDALASPVYAGFAIAVLLSARQVERWKPKGVTGEGRVSRIAETPRHSKAQL